jgi:hypothetical protein
VCPYADADDQVRYTGVWVKDGKPFSAHLALTPEELHRQIAGLEAGWRPDWVSVSKPGGKRLFDVIFVRDDSRPEWLMTIDTPRWGIRTSLNKMRQEGYAPVLLGQD